MIVQLQPRQLVVGKKLYKVVERIRSLPGPRATRLRAVQAYAQPLWSWGSPVFSLPPEDAAQKVMRAILRSTCCWWCRGRFWALHVQLHPLYSAVMTAVHRATTWKLEWNTFVAYNVGKALSYIGLQFIRYDSARGILFRRRENENDARVVQAFDKSSMLSLRSSRTNLHVVLRPRSTSCPQNHMQSTCTHGSE